MSSFNFEGVTWNGLSVTRHVPGHRHVTVHRYGEHAGADCPETWRGAQAAGGPKHRKCRATDRGASEESSAVDNVWH